MYDISVYIHIYIIYVSIYICICICICVCLCVCVCLCICVCVCMYTHISPSLSCPLSLSLPCALYRAMSPSVISLSLAALPSAHRSACSMRGVHASSLHIAPQTKLSQYCTCCWFHLVLVVERVPNTVVTRNI